MVTPSNRTRVTSLSDDELIIFDALFDGFQDATNLTSYAYPWQLNVAYTHSLDDKQLSEFLRSSTASGLLWRKSSVHNGKLLEYFSLSTVGGELWERERLPDWNRYVVTSRRELGIYTTGSQRIAGVSETICRQFAGALFGAGLVKPTGHIRCRSAYNVRLIPWRVFSRICVLRFPILDSVHDSIGYANWEAYNSSRAGWRSLSEIQHYPIEPKSKTMHRSRPTSSA